MEAAAQPAAVEEERRARGLLEPEDLDTWLDAQDLDRTDLPEVARRLAVLRWARDAHRDAVAGEMASAIRSEDAYAGLVTRAERKRDAVASLPSDRATPGDGELVEDRDEDLGDALPPEEPARRAPVEPDAETAATPTVPHSGSSPLRERR